MLKSGVVFLAALGMLTQSAQAQDAENGEKLFKKCAACHQVGDGAKNRVGPALTGVVGRVAGTAGGYKYSKSMLKAGEAGLVWTDDLLADYIADPGKFLKAYLDDPKAKAKMRFMLKKEDERRDVIAYLVTFSDMSDNEEQSALPDSSAAETAANAVCVRNQNTREHLFAVEADGAERRVQVLKSGEVLCTETAVANGQGVVTVFEDADEFEGCSRLVPLGQTEDMLKYVDFDRCFWGSNT